MIKYGLNPNLTYCVKLMLNLRKKKKKFEKREFVMIICEILFPWKRKLLRFQLKVVNMQLS